jgi:hypothetical protein
MSDAPAEPPLAIIDDAILHAVDNQAFSSIQELAKFTCIPTAAVYRQLKSSLGLVVKHLHWVPHDLTEAQKVQHVTLSNQLLRQPRSLRHQSWSYILTLDESWFYFAPDNEQIWL